MYKILVSFFFLYLVSSITEVSINAATNLKLNPNLDYSTDSNDGPLITGDNITDGMIQQGKSAYIIFYHHECYNSKRQAKRTVELYEKYEGNIDFIIVDLDSKISNEQNELRERFYPKYIPHVTIIGANGSVLYNRSGEIGNDLLSSILDKALM